jgi:GTP-binding protein YchF
VDAIVHVLRCFEDGDVTHVEGSIDPLRDADTVETELMLADLDSLEKRAQGLVKRARGGDKEALAQMALIEPIKAALEAGRPARTAVPAGAEEAAKRLQLLTTKPVLYVCNVEEGSAATGNAQSARVFERAKAEGAQAVVVSAAIEAEISQMPQADRGEFLSSLGLEDSGLDRVIRAGYALLGLITYFTVGPKEARAWTILKGMKAPQAAGVIHGDFERGFIAAETIGFDDYVGLGGEQGAKEAGKMRVEGKEYLVRDGDVMLFRFNV